MSARPILGALLAAGLLVATVPADAQRLPGRQAANLPPDVLALACAPVSAFATPPMPLRVTGGQDTITRRIYVSGDLVTINAGTHHGIDVGQEFFVRRMQVSRGVPFSRTAPATIHTAGWLRVYAVDDEMSLATVTHACDSIEVDDYLEPFALPDVPVPSALDGLKPRRENYGRVMAGTDGRRTFATGDFFIVNQGSNDGIARGARLVLYRDKRQDQNFLFDLGEAVAVHVGPDTSTVQVLVARDGIMEGDYVALRR